MCVKESAKRKGGESQPTRERFTNEKRRMRSIRLVPCCCFFSFSPW